MNRNFSLKFSRGLSITVLCLAAGSARADIYILNNDGQVQGETLPGAPAGQYLVRTSSGGQITLDKSQVKQIIPQSPAELEYERIRPTFADTVEDQLKLAQWCHEHSLSKQQKTHLERVVVLDPDNQKARGQLGFMHVDGRWVQHDQFMKESGRVLYKGRWLLPQEVDNIEQQRKEELAQKDFFARLKRWRAKFDPRSDQVDQLHEQLQAFIDPAAVPALKQMVEKEPDDRVKVGLIEALVQIGTSDALSIVINHTLDDPNEEVRWSALDRLAAVKHPETTAIYVKALKSKDNVKVNRAAFCLAKLGDKSAIGPLIEALRTSHEYIIQQGGGPGQISSTFGNGLGGGGGGLAVGGGQKREKRIIDNQGVLDALMQLSGQTRGFQFDKNAWRAWYATQKKTITVDTRRD